MSLYYSSHIHNSFVTGNFLKHSYCPEIPGASEGFNDNNLIMSVTFRWEFLKGSKKLRVRAT